MKRLFTPIMYPAFLIPTLIITLMLVFFSERVYGFIFPGTGEIEALIGILLPGGLLFLVANVLMRKWEDLERPTMADHFRQSSLWYIGLVVGILLAASLYPTERGALMFGELIIALGIAVIAIVINALYLYAARIGLSKRIYLQAAKHKTIVSGIACLAIVVLFILPFVRYTFWESEQDKQRRVFQNEIQKVVTPPLLKEEAITAVKQAYPELQNYPSDNLPPTSIEANGSPEGWYLAFIQNGSGRPILSARCFKVTLDKQVTPTGTYTPTLGEDKQNLSPIDCR